MSDDKYKVTYGTQVVYLNDALVRLKGINDDTLELIKDSHRTRMRIFEDAQKTDDVETLRTLAKEFEQLEFLQQELWGFGRDATYHCWYEFPKCTCPKLDNADLRGVDRRIITLDCPVHGQV